MVSCLEFNKHSPSRAQFRCQLRRVGRLRVLCPTRNETEPSDESVEKHFYGLPPKCQLAPDDRHPVPEQFACQLLFLEREPSFSTTIALGCIVIEWRITESNQRRARYTQWIDDRQVMIILRIDIALLPSSKGRSELTIHRAANCPSDRYANSDARREGATVDATLSNTSSSGGTDRPRSPAESVASPITS